MKMSDYTSSTVTLPMFSFPFALFIVILGLATKRFVGVTYTSNRADVLTFGLWDTYFYV